MTDVHDHDDSPISDCTEALAEIYTFLDGELTDVKRGLIAAHLERCSPCIEAFDFEAELRMVISAKARSDEVPEMLRIRIAERLTMLAQGEITSSEGEPSIGQPPALEA